MSAPAPRRPRHPASLDVSVIVLTFNSADSLPACIASVRPQVDALGGEIVLVDNASTDATVAVARGLGLDPTCTGRNLGFAAGCNRGAREARGRVLVFVNPDAVLDDGCLDALVSEVDDGIGPVGGRAHHGDGSYDPRCALGRPSAWGAAAFATGLSSLLRHHSRFDPENGPAHVPRAAPPRRVVAVSGALMAVPRTLWDRLDGFDERFFLYGEDVDLCLRASEHGWRPHLVPAAGYQHVGGGSSVGGGRDVLLYRGKVELYRGVLSDRGLGAALLALQLGAFLRGVATRIPGAPSTPRTRRWWALFRHRAQWRGGYLHHRGPPWQVRTGTVVRDEPVAPGVPSTVTRDDPDAPAVSATDVSAWGVGGRP